ncbi:MAG: hypothetical protein ACRD0N_00015 [Acidimicrobiales bacterium]
MAARLLALLAAVAMVVGAVAVRNRIDDKEERQEATLRLVCATELRAVCDDLAADDDHTVVATVEPAATTAGRLSALGPGRRAGLDGWLVPYPWPEVMSEARERAGSDTLLAPGPVLARSPVVLAMWPDRAEVLAARCEGGAPEWKCLGEAAGQRWEAIGGNPAWGPVKPGHLPPSTATGLTVLGAAAAAWFGRADLSSADLDDDGFRGWLARLERAVPATPAPTLENMLVRGPSTFDAVGALEAEAGPVLARSARAAKPDLLYPAPVATADVVLASPPGRLADLLAELVGGAVGRRSLAQAGWRVEGQPRVQGVPATPALPPGNGLPSPGLLSALRTAAEEAAR